ncbi:MAG: nucleoside triphosphate pyrophosphohydrolase [Treponema sp.]|jgi:tetrapyrrole methylase family protein/MazG family protein|nr:nucleoside triphosphate pyrophosphohydrolase [Treponema sp.]
MQAASAFGRLCDIVEKLRGEGGCPWDREQTPATLRGDLVEETYECIEAIDEKESGHIREELGDLYLLVTMIAYMHEQAGAFTVGEVLEGIAEKLIRRHPHVFGGLTPEAGSAFTSAQVLDNWARIKVELEGRRPVDSALDEVSRALPPLDRAWKLQKKAAGCGFDWSSIDGLLDKIREELAETERELAAEQQAAGEQQTAAGSDLEAELGDLLFSVVNLCRFLKVEPSVALQRTNVKFARRFRHVEKRMKEKGLAMESGNITLMDGFWEEAKSFATTAQNSSLSV